MSFKVRVPERHPDLTTGCAIEVRACQSGRLPGADYRTAARSETNPATAA